MPDLRRHQAIAEVVELLIPAFDGGLTKQVVTSLSGYPEIAAMIEMPQDDDQAAAEHYALLEHAIQPYGGAFLDREGTVGGPSADYALRASQGTGFSHGALDRSADHLVPELRYTVFLCQASGAEDHLAEFLDMHLLGWLPAFAHAIGHEKGGAYADLSRLLLEVIVELRISCGLPAVIPTIGVGPDPLLDEATGVRDLAEHLSTHARAGFFLGREGVKRLARRAGVPRGFGGKALMLGNLLRSAASYDSLKKVCLELEAQASEAEEYWNQWAAGPGALPVWAAHWQSLAQGSVRLLKEVGTRAG